MLRASIALVATACAASSCILAVPAPNDVSETTCKFQGLDSACGQCIQKSCQAAVNACCLDGGCGDTLSALDRCAPAPTQDACAGLVDPSSNAAADAVRTCIGQSCGAECDTIPCRLDDLPQTDCRDCMMAACTNELQSACGDGFGRIHVLAARFCAQTASEADCSRLSPFNPYAPPAGKALSSCVAANCGKSCPINGANKCSGSKDCIGCCMAAFPKGHDKSFQLDTQCACPPGACAYECRLTAYCQASGPVPGDACLTCLSTNDGWGQPCGFAEACYPDVDCGEFTTCYSQCSAG